MPAMCASSNILEPSEANIQYCADLLRSDHLVAVPTETVYGLAGNSFSEAAVRKIFQTKGRPLIDPLISHFAEAEAAFECVESNTEAKLLAQSLWPGPLTMVLPKKPIVPDLVTAGLPSAAIRVPAHPVFRKLLAQLDFPLAAPSANPFGYVSPTRASHVAVTLGDRVTAILDAGPCSHGIESTIIDLRVPSSPRILRPGPIPAGVIAAILKIPEVSLLEATPTSGPQLAPGMLSKHYSPKASIRILPHGESAHAALSVPDNLRTAIIFNQRPAQLPDTSADLFWLSESDDLEAVARNFFHLLQKCDQAGYDQLIVEAAPDQELGLAINDRLRRAAAKASL